MYIPIAGDDAVSAYGAGGLGGLRRTRRSVFRGVRLSTRSACHEIIVVVVVVVGFQDLEDGGEAVFVLEHRSEHCLPSALRVLELFVLALGEAERRLFGATEELDCGARKGRRGLRENDDASKEREREREKVLGVKRAL